MAQTFPTHFQILDFSKIIGGETNCAPIKIFSAVSLDSFQAHKYPFPSFQCTMLYFVVCTCKCSFSDSGSFPFPGLWVETLTWIFEIWIFWILAFTLIGLKAMRKIQISCSRNGLIENMNPMPNLFPIWAGIIHFSREEIFGPMVKTLQSLSQCQQVISESKV